MNKLLNNVNNRLIAGVIGGLIDGLIGSLIVMPMNVADSAFGPKGMQRESTIAGTN